MLAIEALRMGAQDYLIKGQTDSNLLIRTIHYAMERKRAEETLKASGDRFRELYDYAPVGYHEVNNEGIITRVNHTDLEMLGYSAGEMVGQPVWKFITEEEYVRSVFFGKIFGKIPPGRAYERRYLKKDGTSLLVLAEDRLLRDKEGKIAGLRVTIQDITERKQAEEALKETQRFLEAVVETAPSLIVLTDPDGKIVLFNHSCEELTGYKREEVIGKTIPELFLPPEWIPVVQKRFADPYAPEVQAPHENPWLTKSGEQRLIEWCCTVLPSPQDGRPCILGTGNDITERRRAEAESAGARQILVNITLGITDGILVITKDFKIIWANEGSLRMAGCKMEELVGNYCYKATHNSESPCQPPHDICPVREVINAGNPVTVTHTHFDKEGNELFVEVSAYPVKDEKGEIIQFVHLCRDITERKRAEEALRRSEEKYRAILETIEEGYFEVDIAGTFFFFNDSLCRLFGYSRDEMMGMNNRQYTDSENAQKLYQTFNRVYRTGKPTKEFDWEIIRKDGTKKNTEASVSLIKNPSDNRIGFRGIVRDITDRKRAEEEKATLQEQLRQSQKIEAIGRLAGGIAHDFNNLLTVIKGYSQLSLIELKEDVPLRGNIEEIKRASEKAADLTRQLLAFSRRQILEMRVLDLNTVLRDLDKMLRRVIGEDIELITLLADDLGRVKTDPGWVEQTIMNLAVNARDAMPSVGKLTIETANVELDETYARNHIAVTPGRYVMLSMSDTGIGMTPEVRQQVFEPFFTTKEKGKGTGLGLSTVYGIVKQSEGNIWVYSEPGKGTTFKIYLPRVDEPLEEIKERVVKEELPRGSETILLVEDEEMVRKLAVQILKRQGYTVLEGSHGNEAFNICNKHDGPIHLLVTDVVMPKMSGLELAERIASIQPEIKVLYMSGYTDNAITHHGVLEKGMNYIQKPFTVDGLARKVREVLDN
jgi:PAS domain S-box-containing protein